MGRGASKRLEPIPPVSRFAPGLEHIPSRPPAGLKAGSVRKDEIPVACEAILRRLDDYIDRELSADDVLMIERHLEECFDCVSQYRFEIRLIHDIRARLRRLALPGDLMTRIKLRLDAETVG
jgi:anti-sigma factor (TIGR02949 family)